MTMGLHAYGVCMMTFGEAYDAYDDFGGSIKIRTADESLRRLASDGITDVY